MHDVDLAIGVWLGAHANLPPEELARISWEWVTSDGNEESKASKTGQYDKTVILDNAALPWRSFGCVDCVSTRRGSVLASFPPSHCLRGVETRRLGSLVSNLAASSKLIAFCLVLFDSSDQLSKALARQGELVLAICLRDLILRWIQASWIHSHNTCRIGQSDIANRTHFIFLGPWNSALWEQPCCHTLLLLKSTQRTCLYECRFVSRWPASFRMPVVPSKPQLWTRCSSLCPFLFRGQCMFLADDEHWVRCTHREEKTGRRLIQGGRRRLTFPVNHF